MRSATAATLAKLHGCATGEQRRATIRSMGYFRGAQWVMATWEDVAGIVGEFQLTDERSPHEWRVGRKLIAWERPLRKSDREALAALGIEPPEGDILGVRVADEGVKFALIADEPDLYFTTPHFDGYPAVLVKLDEIDELGLREVITEAWLTQAPKQLVREFLGEVT
jgi:hypothetical protein